MRGLMGQNGGHVWRDLRLATAQTTLRIGLAEDPMC